MIDDCNINNLAKNQVSAVFHSRVICRSVLPKFRELCMESPCLCPSEGQKHGGRDVRKTFVVEFFCKSESLFLEELKNIKIILFPIQEPVQIATFPEISPKISHFLTN